MQVAVVGLGVFGRSVAETLGSLGGEVLAIDKDADLIESIKDTVAQAIVADATDERTLRAIGMPEVDAAVVGVGDMSASIMATLLLRRLGLSRIVVRSLSEIHSSVLTEVGASRVIPIERQMGEQIAKTLIAPHIMDRTPFAEGFSFVEVRAPHFLVGRTVQETSLREKYRLNLVAIQHRASSISEEGRSIIKLVTNGAPKADDVIDEGSVLVLAGSDCDIDAFFKGET